ncbi:MmgE/PrpD family protein [soil metagenome]
MIPDITAQVARFVADFRWAELPEAVRREAKRSLVNYFAVALGGCHEPPVEKALATMRAFTGPATASIVGRADRTDLLNAAFVNAMSANVFDFDDTHPATIIHPTAPVAPALFALAETQALSGEDLLLAFVLGAELECRIGNAVSPGHYRRGWHITSTCGVFGAALAVGKACGLDAQALGWTIGNASVQACGLVEGLGTMSKSISVGNSARNGALAALLAREGFSGPEHPLEGNYGFLRVTSEAPDFDAITGELGTRWELLANTYKPYPVGVVLNPVLEACLALQREGRIDLARIERIEITGHPLLRERTDRPDVMTGRQSQVSAQHAVGVALLRGSAGIDEFSDAAVADPAIRALGRKVAFVDDDRFAVDAARITITQAGGVVIGHEVEHAYAGAMRPMTDADLAIKLESQMKRSGAARSPGALIDALDRLEQLADAGSVMRLAVALTS